MPLLQPIITTQGKKLTPKFSDLQYLPTSMTLEELLVDDLCPDDCETNVLSLQEGFLLVCEAAPN